MAPVSLMILAPFHPGADSAGRILAEMGTAERICAIPEWVSRGMSDPAVIFRVSLLPPEKRLRFAKNVVTSVTIHFL